MIFVTLEIDLFHLFVEPLVALRCFMVYGVRKQEINGIVD